MKKEMIEGVFEHCYLCRKVTPQNKIIEDNKPFYVCCVCGNRRRKWK